MKIRYKLLLSFALATVLPILIISGIIFIGFQNILTDQIYQKLENSAQIKVKSIEAFYDGIRNDLIISQDYFNIKNNLPILIRLQKNRDSAEYTLAKETLDSQLRTFQRVKGFSDMMLTDLAGNILYATNSFHEDVNDNRNIREFGDAFNNFDNEQIFISDIFKNTIPKKDYEYGIIFSGPAKDLSGKIIGSIIFEVNAQFLYNILTENDGMVKTEETIIGKRFNADEIIILSPTQKSPIPPLEEKFSIKESGEIPMVKALINKNIGQAMALDYAGDKVIAYWQYIPSRDWGLVVKVDTAEAFREVITLKYTIFTGLLALFIVIAFATSEISRTISGPIEELRHGAEIITGGNLDYKFGEKSSGEIGQLENAFDMMTEGLKNSNEMLHEEVRMRTRELDDKVDELEKFNSFMMNREIRMAELKKENELLKNQLNKDK